LRDLGADAVVDLTRCDDEVVGAFRREAGDSGYGVILDSVWGHPTGLLLQALVPDQLSFAQHGTHLVQIGVSAGRRSRSRPRLCERQGFATWAPVTP
jgi:NADPH:quinone reductase-like Zn-dependent oxidoreductase